MKSSFSDKPIQGLLTLALGWVLSGCAAERPTETYKTVAQPIVGTNAAGAVPTGLPGRFMLGLFEGQGQTWMLESQVPWDLRYQYFTMDWASNWGYGPRNGDSALWYFYDCYDSNTIPAVQYYQLVKEPGGGEQETLAKLGNAGTMNAYFADFRIMMDRVKDYGAPVVIMIEADAVGFLEHQANGNSSWYAAVSASGFPDVAGLPDTIAGWGLSFLKIKQAAGADNAILGLHVSAWGSPQDPIGDPGASITDAVNAGFGFLGPFGISANQTGITYDFLTTDPADRDNDYYQLLHGSNRWWDSSDSAGLDTKSFNRYAEWLHQWNVKSGKRWILWQIPLGNSNHLNVFNNGNPREGYKDNRTEYFLGNGLAHIQKFADAGVMALLFGAGASGMSGHSNDVYTDGQLFTKTRAQALYNAGGLEITTGAGWMATDAGPNPRPEVSFEAGPPPKVYDESFTAQYEFETDDELLQGWTTGDASIATLAQTSDTFYRGSKALAIQMTGKAGTAKVSVGKPTIVEGMPYVLFHIYLPTGHKVKTMMPHVTQAPITGYEWISDWKSTTELPTEGWAVVAVEIPDATYPIWEIGLNMDVGPDWTGSVYVDTVGWPDPAAYEGDAGFDDAGNPITTGGTSGTGGASGSGASQGTGSSSGAGNKDDDEKDKGCSCRIQDAGNQGEGGWVSMGALLAFTLLRRRSSHQQAA